MHLEAAEAIKARYHFGRKKNKGTPIQSNDSPSNSHNRLQDATTTTTTEGELVIPPPNWIKFMSLWLLEKLNLLCP